MMFRLQASEKAWRGLGMRDCEGSLDMGEDPLHWALGGLISHWPLSFSCPQPSLMLSTHLVSRNRPEGRGMEEA